MKEVKSSNTEAFKVKEEKYYCSVCGREIRKEEYEAFDEMCWDDQLTEESKMMFGDVM